MVGYLGGNSRKWTDVSQYVQEVAKYFLVWLLGWWFSVMGVIWLTTANDSVTVSDI